LNAELIPLLEFELLESLFSSPFVTVNFPFLGREVNAIDY